MRAKILRSTMIMAMVVLLGSITLILSSLYPYFNGIRSQHLRDQLSLAATATEQSGLQYLSHVESSRFRLTWIDREGNVLYDTRMPYGQMENHLDREEFREALETGTGSAVRDSDTLTERTVYEATALANGTLLRISAKSDTALGLLSELIPAIVITIGVTLLLSFHLSRRISKKIVTPINSIDPEHPLEGQTPPEIAPLLQRLHSQNLQIRSHIQELAERAEEFRRITDSMQEGLILTDCQGNIRSMNPAAQRIFCPENGTCPRTIAALDTEDALRKAYDLIPTQGDGTVRILKNGKYYRIDLSNIRHEDTTLGIVLLAIDITESVNAQINRREFSANVSHELKTPLQTILGSVELLENGFVKEEDMPRFYGHIRKEATRLLDLVKDILRLSQMEERAAMTAETVDMTHLCAECLTELRSMAAEKNITIREQTEPATLYGVPRLLHDLVSNLCRNAILYNVEGGTLLLKLQSTPHCLILTVKDTGIGISQEHHEKIFERFYRVDKSHSRASGGTGLGLSIVKHAAEYHNATISLTSSPGQGTEIRVTFPLQSI